MLAVRLMTFASLLLPAVSFGGYNPDKIKLALQANQSLYKISTWEQTDISNQWVADTPIKLLNISISDDIAIVKSPHISPPQKQLAKKRCVDFGEIGISPKSDEEKTKISKLVRIATQKHIPQFTDMNGVRFEVLPEMKGTYVSLICRLKPSTANLN